MRDVTIVVAHRGNPLGLWATIQSCEMDLEGSGLSWDYSIVTNGEEAVHADALNVIQHLKRSEDKPKLASHHHSVAPMSPPAARQLGATKGDGRFLFFFDNHIMVAKDYFRRAIADFDHYGIDMLHSTYRFYSDEGSHYHYKLKLARNFWGESCRWPKDSHKPYRLAVGGHGGFAVRRNTWDEVGGYWDGFTGYGGEEVYFDLKMWMLGKQVWIDPRVIHYHFAGDRGYNRHYTDDYLRNMMMSANIIGGYDWLEKVYTSFSKGFKHASGRTLFQVMTEAEERSREHAAWLASKRNMPLDELLRWFTSNDVAWT